MDQVASAVLDIGFARGIWADSTSQPVDNAFRRLREECQAQQALYDAQPSGMRRMLDEQARKIAEALVQGQRQLSFALPDQVSLDEELMVVPAEFRKQNVAGLLGRLPVAVRRDIRAAVRQRLSQIEQSNHPAVAVCARLVRYAVVRYIVNDMLPTGGSATAGEDEATRRFYMPQWFALDDERLLAPSMMRYLKPTLSLIVAVVLIQDYVLTVVVSTLSGGDQLLSILNAYSTHWFWHFAIGVALATVTYYLTIRGRGESAQVVFTMLGIFGLLTVTMVIGLFIAHWKGVPPVPAEPEKSASLAQALMHLLTASMKGMVALSGLEAMSNGIQFVIDEDAGIVKWGKRRLPRLGWLWKFYSGKSGIGHFVQTAFLFYGGLTTLFLTFFGVRFNVFDGTLGRTIVGNLAFIGFGQIPGGTLLFWAYQVLAVGLLAAASMTAFQDVQATAWRDVAIGEIPEFVVHRNLQGTFTRSVTAAYVAAIFLMFLVRGQTTLAVPYYGVGVFMPIMVMGLAIRQHMLKHYAGRTRTWGAAGATFSAGLAALVFVGQIVGKWQEGGWVVLISFNTLAIAAHLLLLSPIGYREPQQIHRIVRDKARVQGAMAPIVEWQSLKMQEYRYGLLIGISRFFELFGVRRPVRYELPAVAGEYDDALHVDHPEARSFLDQYMSTLPEPQPRLGGQPRQTAEPEPGPAA